MAEPVDSTQVKKRFLDVEGAEIVHGPDVIAGKVSSALKDADRFHMPSVKPPLSEALDRVQTTGESTGEGEVAEQDALSGKSAEVDEKAGSAEVLKPVGKFPA